MGCRELFKGAVGYKLFVFPSPLTCMNYRTTPTIFFFTTTTDDPHHSFITIQHAWHFIFSFFIPSNPFASAIFQKSRSFALSSPLFISSGQASKQASKHTRSTDMVSLSLSRKNNKTRQDTMPLFLLSLLFPFLSCRIPVSSISFFFFFFSFFSFWQQEPSIMIIFFIKQSNAYPLKNFFVSFFFPYRFLFFVVVVLLYVL